MQCTTSTTDVRVVGLVCSWIFTWEVKDPVLSTSLAFQSFSIILTVFIIYDKKKEKTCGYLSSRFPAMLSSCHVVISERRFHPHDSHYLLSFAMDIVWIQHEWVLHNKRRHYFRGASDNFRVEIDIRFIFYIQQISDILIYLHFSISLGAPRFFRHADFLLHYQIRGPSIEDTPHIIPERLPLSKPAHKVLEEPSVQDSHGISPIWGSSDANDNDECTEWVHIVSYFNFICLNHPLVNVNETLMIKWILDLRTMDQQQLEHQSKKIKSPSTPFKIRTQFIQGSEWLIHKRLRILYLRSPLLFSSLLFLFSSAQNQTFCIEKSSYTTIV